jgi:hypothetical protein
MVSRRKVYTHSITPKILPFLRKQGNHLKAVFNPVFDVNILNMGFHGFYGDMQVLSDLPVADNRSNLGLEDGRDHRFIDKINDPHGKGHDMFFLSGYGSDEIKRITRKDNPKLKIKHFRKLKIAFFMDWYSNCVR